MRTLESILRSFLLAMVVWCGANSADGSDCAEKTHFTFNWPVPSTAIVETHVDDAGEVSRIRFTINLGEEATPDEFLVTFSNFEFLQLGDADLSDPAVRAEMAILMAMAAAIPPMVISKEGKFLRIDEWDRMIDDLVVFLRGTDPTLNEEAIKHLGSIMKNPATRQQLQSASAQDWSLWVGAWSDIQLCPGETSRFTYPMSMPWGGQFDALVELTYLPIDTVDKVVHRLQYKTIASGPKIRDGLLESLKKLVPPAELDDAKIADMNASIGECSISFYATVTTNPATLMPLACTSTKVIRIGSADGRVEEKTERREYTFFWK